jgi:tetratricopeptide (TPR) repeat protein
MPRKPAVILGVLVALLLAGHGHAAVTEAVKRNNVGADFLKQNKHEEAIAEFQRAIEVDPSYVAAHFNLAYALECAKRFDEAIAQYERALQLGPDNVFGLNNLGVLYTNKRRYDEAIKVLEQAAKIEPSNSTVSKNLENARQNKSILQERGARITEARKQVEARPQDSGAAYNLARVYASLDMIDEAFEWLGKALKLGFDNIEFVREDPVLLGLKKDPRFAAMLEGK